MPLPHISLNCSGAAKVTTDRPQTVQVKEGHRTIDLSRKLCDQTEVMPWTFNSNKDFWKAHCNGWDWQFYETVRNLFEEEKTVIVLYLRPQQGIPGKLSIYVAIFLIMDLGWVSARIKEGKEIFEILGGVKCKYNRCLNSLEFLVSRLTSIYQGWERNNHGTWCCLGFFSFFLTAESYSKNCHLRRKRKGSERKISEKLHQDIFGFKGLMKSYGYHYPCFSFALTKQTGVRAAQQLLSELLLVLHFSVWVWGLRAPHCFVQLLSGMKCCPFLSTLPCPSQASRMGSLWAGKTPHWA